MVSARTAMMDEVKVTEVRDQVNLELSWISLALADLQALAANQDMRDLENALKIALRVAKSTCSDFRECRPKVPLEWS